MSTILHPDVMIDQLLWEHDNVLAAFQDSYETYNYMNTGLTCDVDLMLAAEDAMCDLLEALEHIEFMIEWFGGDVPVLEDEQDDGEMDVCKCTQCKCQD